MLAIIESPYQLQNSLSLFDTLGIKNKDRKILVRDNGNEIQKKQYMLNKLNADVMFFYLPARGIKKVPLLMYFYLKYFYLLLSTKCLVIGDARSIICRPLIKLLKYFNKKVYLVDDGLYLLSHVSKLEKVNCTIYTSLPIVETKDSSFFVLKKEIAKFSDYERNKSVSFIGQHLVELGFISEDKYISELRKIIDLYKDEYINFNYYMHRSESESKIKQVEVAGFNVISLPTSIESYFYENKAPQGVFISFYSTALLNIFNAHKGSDFYFISKLLTLPSDEVINSIGVCHNVMKLAGICELEVQE